MKLLFMLLALPFFAILAVLLIVISPLVLVYFLFSRFLSCLEYFKPQKKGQNENKKGTDIVRHVFRALDLAKTK